MLAIKLRVKVAGLAPILSAKWTSQVKKPSSVLLALLLGKKPASELSNESLLTVVNSQTEGAKGAFSHAHSEDLGLWLGNQMVQCRSHIFKRMHLFVAI